MTASSLSRRTIVFVNIAHALDHFVLLIYPTAVIVMATEMGLDYGSLVGLAAGAFIAFGLFSLPMGWIALRIGRRNMLAVFFLGYGASCFGMASAATSLQLTVWLIVLGVFSAIYHPIGTTMLVSHTRRLGWDLGWNGVWGNLGAAFASGVTAVLANFWGWRVAFVAPGLVCVIAGLAFVLLVPAASDSPASQSSQRNTLEISRPVTWLLFYAIAIIAGGMTFNITSIALPKIIDERLGVALPLSVVGSLATCVFVFGALTQLLMGRLLDRYSLPAIFVCLTLFQPIGLGLASVSTGYPLLVGLTLAMAAIYGQVVVNDAMIARYVSDRWRAQAFSARYFLGFTASGFAAPLIGVLYSQGGFTTVLLTGTAFGAVIFLSGLALYVVASAARPVIHPAE